MKQQSKATKQQLTRVRESTRILSKSPQNRSFGQATLRSRMGRDSTPSPSENSGEEWSDAVLLKVQF